MMAQEDRKTGERIGETAHCLVPSSPRAHGGRPQKTRASSDLQDKSSNAKRLGAAETANRNQADHADIFFAPTRVYRVFQSDTRSRPADAEKRSPGSRDRPEERERCR